MASWLWDIVKSCRTNRRVMRSAAQAVGIELMHAKDTVLGQKALLKEQPTTVIPSPVLAYPDLWYEHRLTLNGCLSSYESAIIDGYFLNAREFDQAARTAYQNRWLGSNDEQLIDEICKLSRVPFRRLLEDDEAIDKVAKKLCRIAGVTHLGAVKVSSKDGVPHDVGGT